tara:strand:+ start:128 stop:301 length:174 start_codon:yes stop_codon:yes gene_type:complete
MTEFTIKYKTIIMYWKDQRAKTMKVSAMSELDAEFLFCDKFDNSCLSKTIYECEVLS